MKVGKTVFVPLQKSYKTPAIKFVIFTNNIKYILLEREVALLYKIIN